MKRERLLLHIREGPVEVALETVVPSGGDPEEDTGHAEGLHLSAGLGTSEGPTEGEQGNEQEKGGVGEEGGGESISVVLC